MTNRSIGVSTEFHHCSDDNDRRYQLVRIDDYLKKSGEPIYWEKNQGAVFKATVINDWTEIGQSVPTLNKAKNPTVVVKCCFLMTEKDIQYFEEAYERLKLCNHKNIVTVFFSGIYSNPEIFNTKDTMNAFVMEAGEQSLADLLENKQCFPIADGGITMTHCMSWIKQISSALAYLHRKGIVHRDVKPRNILMFDASSVCKLCDFDDSREVSSRMTVEVGTGHFMAPEVSKLKNKDEIKRKYTETCDCYSFGMTVLAILFRDPDCSNLKESDSVGLPTSVSCFISDIESNEIDLKSSCFCYDSHAKEFKVIKEILDKALQASSAQRLSSKKIKTMLKEAGAEDYAPELKPKASTADASCPKIPTIQSTSRKSRTVVYQALLENRKFNSSQIEQVKRILNAVGERVNGKVPGDRPVDVKHEFIVIDPRESSEILIEHNMGYPDQQSAIMIEEYCSKEEHFNWLSKQFEEDNDVELRKIRFSAWIPGNIEQ